MAEDKFIWRAQHALISVCVLTFGSFYKYGRGGGCSDAICAGFNRARGICYCT